MNDFVTFKAMNIKTDELNKTEDLIIQLNIISLIAPNEDKLKTHILLTTEHRSYKLLNVDFENLSNKLINTAPNQFIYVELFSSIYENDKPKMIIINLNNISSIESISKINGETDNEYIGIIMTCGTQFRATTKTINIIKDKLTFI